MDFDLTDDQKALRDKAREVSLRELAPAAPRIDREPGLTQAMLKRLAELGIFGLGVPKAWGGAGADTLSCALAIEEFASACASTALIASIQNLVVSDSIVRFGSEAQKRSWLPALATGSKLGCFVGPRPGTTFVARRDAGGWLLDGSAAFVHAAPLAHAALVVASVPSAPAPSLAVFLVPMDLPGLTVGPTLDKLGLRGALAAPMKLERAMLPADALLGTEARGEEVLQAMRDGGRLGVAALALGIAHAAFAAATAYALGRQAHAQPLAEQQTIQFMLAEMSTHIDAARVLTWRAAARRDRPGAGDASAAMAKLMACQAAVRVTADAVEVLGSDGCLDSFAVERHFRDAKVLATSDGTVDSERLGIASVLLKD